MNKVLKSTIILMFVTILSKILGFGREIILANIYGASAYSDVYLISVNIPNIIFASIGAALATTFIPLYCDIECKEGEERAKLFTNNVINIIIIICIVLSVVGVIFAKPLVRLFAVGFKDETLSLAIKFTRILIFSIGFIGLSNLIGSYLNIKNNFFVPGMIGLPSNIIIIFSIILSKKNIYILPIGALLATFSQLLFQLPSARKEGYKYSLHIDFKDKYLKKMILLVAPIFVGASVNQINTTVDRTIASTLSEGSISALNYANKLNLFVMALFVTCVGSVIYPKLSKLSSQKDSDGFLNIVNNSITAIIIIVIPISIGAMVLSEPIIKILFERGAFDNSASKMTSDALIFYSIGMLGFGMREILCKVFYSLKDTKTPMKNGIIGMIINIILNIKLSNIMNHSGLALATSISAIVSTILLLINLKKKIKSLNVINLICTAMKAIISSLVMALVVRNLYTILLHMTETNILGEIISLGLAIIGGIVTYLLIMLILNIRNINQIISKSKQLLKLNKKQVKAIS